MDAGTCTVADCSNPACNALYSCVDAPPVGWTGPVALYFGPMANADPGCPASFPANVDPAYLGNAGFSAAPATCAACACGAVNGQQTCTFPTEVYISDATCNAQHCDGILPVPGWTGACQGPHFFAGGVQKCGGGAICMNGSGPCNVSVSSAAPKVTGGTCLPAGGQATKPTVAWATFGRGCGDPEMTAIGCGNGLLCLPKPAAPFQKGACVFQAGDIAACPAAFSDRHLFYQGVTDTRDCAACSCGAATGTCTVQINVFGDQANNTCVTPVTSFTAGTCAPLSGNPAVGSVNGTVTSPPSGGTCAPGGGVPEGTAVAAQPTTFCCAP